MPKKFVFSKWLIRTLIKSLLLAILLTLIIGYVLGYRAFLVNGWSAQPIIRYESVIVTAKAKVEDLKVGDIITFGKTAYTTHQIVRINYDENYVVCQGFQYNSETEEYEYQNTIQVVQEDNIQGKVIYSNYILGKMFITIKNNPFILITLIIGIGFCLYFKTAFKTEP